MADSRHLEFLKAPMGTFRDNSNFDSEYIQVAFLKLSASYNFFTFPYCRKSNALGLYAHWFFGKDF